MTKQERLERAEAMISAIVRMIVSLTIPLWGVVMLILGLADRSLWWIASGGVVLGVGAILLVANPLVWPLLRDLEYDR
jgi:hypothetical protein